MMRIWWSLGKWHFFKDSLGTIWWGFGEHSFPKTFSAIWNVKIDYLYIYWFFIFVQNSMRKYKLIQICVTYWLFIFAKNSMRKYKLIIYKYVWHMWRKQCAARGSHWAGGEGRYAHTLVVYISSFDFHSFLSHLMFFSHWHFSTLLRIAKNASHFKYTANAVFYFSFTNET